MRNKASSPCRRALPYSCTGKWHKLYQYNRTDADLKHLPQRFRWHKPLNKEGQNHTLSWQSYTNDVTRPKGTFTLKLGWFNTVCDFS